jgi:hypothetical protein
MMRTRMTMRSQSSGVQASRATTSRQEQRGKERLNYELSLFREGRGLEGGACDPWEGG